MITKCFQLTKAKKRRASAPPDLPEQVPERDAATEEINGVTVTEDALKKIGRNILKGLGIGLDDLSQKAGLLSHNKRKALKSCQVIYSLSLKC